MVEGLLAGLCRALGLLKPLAQSSSLVSQFPTDSSLGEPQGLANLGLGLALLAQGIQLITIFVGEPTIRAHA